MISLFSSVGRIEIKRVLCSLIVFASPNTALYFFSLDKNPVKSLIPCLGRMAIPFDSTLNLSFCLKYIVAFAMGTLINGMAALI